MLFPSDVFATFFITMGPLKAFLVYVQLTRNLDVGVRRQIALKAVAVATATGILFIFAGKFLLDFFHFSTGAFMIAGGAILFVFALDMVLSRGDGNKLEDYERDPTTVAIFPLAIPLIAQPIGIVALTVASVRFDDDLGSLALITAMLLLVMAINIAVLSFADRISAYIRPEALQTAVRILGILLCGLAVQTILEGADELGIVNLPASGHQ